MWRFVLRENIRRFRAQLAQEQSESKRAVIRGLLQEAEAELKELESHSAAPLAKGHAALQLFADQAIERAMKLHRAQFGVLQIYDRQQDGLVILAQKNFHPQFLRPFALIKLDDTASLGARCFNEGKTFAIKDVEQDPLFKERRPTARQGGFGAVQSSPVRNKKGAVIGVLSTHFTTPQRFSEEDLIAMDQFASSIGPELEKRLAAAAT